MGFHIKKTFKSGPFNFNLSKSGLGYSFGIPGFRIGVDGKGRTYIGGGKGVLRYREYIKGNEGTTLNLTKNTNNNIGYLIGPFIISIFLCILYPPLGVFLLLILTYRLPYSIAELNKLTNKTDILLINICLGWTIIGWFVALFMALKGYKKSKKITELENYFYDDNCSDKIELLNQLININPLKEKEYKLSTVYFLKNNGEYEKALNLLETSYLGDIRQLKMQLLNKLERYQEVVNILQKDFTEDERKEHPALYAFLAEAFLKLNQPQAAIECLMQGPVNARKMTDELCAFRYALGECYEAVNDLQNAKKQYSKIYAYDTAFEDVAEKLKNLTA